jgi:ppGpp synthetase/RelA/SpoT-type nucleotidyltranferase
VSSLAELFEDSTIVDRRQNPSHGYRAVHVIVKLEGKAVEVQVRTILQHGWAELSEKLSDLKGPSIKYGGGDAGTRMFLEKASLLVARHEQLESEINERQLAATGDATSVANQSQDDTQLRLESELRISRQEVLSWLRPVDLYEEKNDAVSD